MYLEVWTGSSVYINGGQIMDLYTWTGSSVYVDGGQIDYLKISRGAYTNIADGDIKLASVWKGDISGGEIGSLSVNGLCNITGGVISELVSGGTVYIYGSGFNYDYGAITDSIGTLTGVLNNGDIINSSFEISEGGSIVLIPEPGSLLLLGLGSVLLRRKKKV